MTNHIFFRNHGKTGFAAKIVKLFIIKKQLKKYLLVLILTCGSVLLSDRSLASDKKTPQFKSIESDDESSKKQDSEEAASTPGKTQSEDKSNNDLQVQGVVRQIRGSPETDVFIQGVSERIIIPGNSKHNEIMNECLNSMKTGKSLSFTIDPISRQIRTWKNSPTNSTGSATK